MNINKTVAIGIVSGACIVSSLLTILADPTLHRLRRHGVHVKERTIGGKRSLLFLAEANNVTMRMNFKQLQKKPSAYEVIDLGGTRITVGDKDQDGRIDALTLNITRDGIDYVYKDPYIEGDYSRMAKLKGTTILENMLKIDGKWLPAKHAGTKAIVKIEGKEVLVDPNKSPIAILGPVAPKPAPAPAKP